MHTLSTFLTMLCKNSSQFLITINLMHIFYTVYSEKLDVNYIFLTDFQTVSIELKDKG